MTKWYTITRLYSISKLHRPSPKRQIVQSIPTKHFAPDRLVSPLLPPQWTWAPGGHATSPYLSSHNQLLLAPKLRPAGGTEKRPQAVWGWRRSHSLITFLPRQHSSRQRLQQINLPLTVHLDWINLELGAITAIGRRGYSPNAGCYPALGIKRKSQLLVFLSLSSGSSGSGVFFSADHRAEWGRHWIFSLTKWLFFSINRQTMLIVCAVVVSCWGPKEVK